MLGKIEYNLKTENNIQLILNELPEFITMYYFSIASATTPKTCETYLKQIRNYLRSINPNTNHITIADINEYTVGRYMKSIQTKTVNGEIRATSFSYQKTVWSSLNGLFCYLEKQKLLVENPMNVIKRPIYKDSVKRINVSVDDINEMLIQVDCGAGSPKAKSTQLRWKERDKLIILLFASTGMRCTALSEINIQDIDFKLNTVQIVDKRNTYHSYYMSETLQVALNDWLKKRRELKIHNEDALFVSSFGGRLASKSIYNVIRKYSEEALGKAISPHKLRAAFCTILYEKTHDIEFVKDAVGHKSVNTTSRYIYKDASAKKQASDIMGNLF